MGNRMSEAAEFVPASQISPALIGSIFGYPGGGGWFFGKIAAIEVQADESVRLTVGDVQIPDGGSLVINLAASESIWVEIEHTEDSVIVS